ncbi:MAG: hypothetical protein J5I35_04110, partial [Methanothrix harundinacea]|nr:hypothetical protein [Methanothrix harundinacea]
LSALLTREKEMDAEDAERKKTPEPKDRDPTPEETEILQEMALGLMKNWPEISAPQLSKTIHGKKGLFIPFRVVESWFGAEGWKRTGTRLNGGETWIPPVQEVRG